MSKFSQLIALLALVGEQGRSHLKPGTVGEQGRSRISMPFKKQQDEENGKSQELAIKTMIEEYSKLAYLVLGLCFAVLYCVLLKTTGRTGNETKGMMAVHVWSVVMIVSFLISWFLRCPFAIMKLVRLVISGLLFVSSLYLVVLLQLTL